MEIVYIPAEKIENKKKLKVSAYCRVSSNSDEQYGSLRSQVRHYENYIDSNPNWINAGVFYERCSGKNIEKREEFKKLIKKCKAGRVDVIIVKSVSRFSRNAMDLIKICRDFKEKEIDIWFESENIKLLGEKSMYVLEILAGIAEEESRCKSQNIKWGIQRGFEKGTSGYAGFDCYGYTKGDEGLEIVESQAEVVRNIFMWKVSGDSLNTISKKLMEQNIKTPTGKDVWSRETINKLIKNEKYCGNILLQKSFVENYFNGKQVKNRGEMTKNFIRRNHQAIISEELFNLANPKSELVKYQQ